VRSIAEIRQLLAATEEELRELDARRAGLSERIGALRAEQAEADSRPGSGTDEISAVLAWRSPAGTVSNASSPAEKIVFFRNLFRGREDVYPRRFESMKTGRSGYQPACANEWVRPICHKPKGKCSDCEHRAFLPVSDETIRSHLLGRDVASRSQRDFTIGVYPMLPDETCCFLAVDFDKSAWADDAGKRGLTRGGSMVRGVASAQAVVPRACPRFRGRTADGPLPACLAGQAPTGGTSTRAMCPGDRRSLRRWLPGRVWRERSSARS
jgi:hypothetical protein